MIGRQRRLGWTRRAVLSSFGGMTLSAFGESETDFPSEAFAYPDPATDLTVVRLTNPSYSSCLSHDLDHSLARNGSFLIYASDRTGSLQAFRLDTKSGQSALLTRAEALDASTLSLSADERSIFYFDGASLVQTFLANRRTREIYRVPEGWQPHHGLRQSGDGRHATFVEASSGVSRLQLLAFASRTATTVVTGPGELSDPIPRPRRDGILYRRGDGGLWLVNYDGQQNRPLKLAPGAIGPVHWTPGGRSVLYLSSPEDPQRLTELREHVPDSNSDQLIAPTSQYACFGANEDASVFVGASRSKASPYVLLLLRVTRRELTLCQHRASNPATVNPQFSRDSQRIFFQSDMHGRQAIYGMAIDTLVEKTQTESG